jgi:uncharacterized protein YbbK (DUF523 family)
MREFSKPILIVSKCLGFAHCRYDGLIVNDDFVDKLKGYVEFKPICAEVEIGLGIPRDPVRIVNINGKNRLIQPSTGRDLTDDMQNFTNSFLDSVGEVDGFILKSRSPSCGLKDVKIYSDKGDNVVIEKGSGFFGGAVLQKFPYLAVEDEARLSNFRIREHFLTQIYTFANFRRITAVNTIPLM